MRRPLQVPRFPEDEAAFYRERYPDGYRHDVWPDHVERLRRSADFIAQSWGGAEPPGVVADLSCGDGGLARLLSEAWPQAQMVLGDLVPGSRVHLNVVGPLPDTLSYLGPEPVDLLVCSETLEHLADPDELLRAARLKARCLFVSTPAGETERHGNAEHYWSWEADDLDGMLRSAGWKPRAHCLFTPVAVEWYTFQLWLAS